LGQTHPNHRFFLIGSAKHSPNHRFFPINSAKHTPQSPLHVFQIAMGQQAQITCVPISYQSQWITLRKSYCCSCPMCVGNVFSMIFSERTSGSVLLLLSSH
ncbi:unnamed protein product, partial [Ectocarpus sp. 4 AP-2014]